MGDFPNKDTQFKKGKSGNPEGLKKGTKNYSTRIKELLSAISDDKEWTSPLAAEKVKIIFAKDKKGEYLYGVDARQKAIDSILDRNEGKPLQKTDVTTDGHVSIDLISKDEEKI